MPKTLAELEQLILKANQAYYGDDEPIMDDAQYDALIKEFTALGGTISVGAANVSKLSKREHIVPMMSLDNAMNEIEARKFIETVQSTLNQAPITFISEWKLDGLSLSLFYKDGKMLYATTRGDGTNGEDVTPNALVIPSIPKNIPELSEIEVRGEVFMTKADFMLLNERAVENGRKPYSNPRNSASGALRQDDPQETANRPLKFAAYSLGAGEIAGVSSQEELLQKFSDLGFLVIPHLGKSTNIDQILEIHSNANLARPHMEYDVDGVVHKVNEFSPRSILGETRRVPKWAIAHKFDPMRAITTLRGITEQVGRTGTITPVAELEPVNIGGVIVTRATLHNVGHVRDLDIRVGDTISIYRSGDVIPRIESVDISKRTEAITPWTHSTHCPSCQGELSLDAENIILRCTNVTNCPAQITERIRHIVSRDVLDVEGLGGEKIEELHSLGFLKTAADLWRLKGHKNDLENLPGWGVRSVKVLLTSLEARKEVNLHRFITALGIREVGRTSGKILAKNFLSFENFKNTAEAAASGDEAAKKKLKSIEGIGDIVLKSITDFFSDERAINSTLDLLSVITPIDEEKPEVNEASPIIGKIVVFTGSLEKMTREEAIIHAESLGAKSSGSVSKKTDILVYGPGAGSKLTRAQELGVTLMTESEWIEFVGFTK